MVQMRDIDVCENGIQWSGCLPVSCADVKEVECALISSCCHGWSAVTVGGATETVTVRGYQEARGKPYSQFIFLSFLVG